MSHVPPVMSGPPVLPGEQPPAWLQDRFALQRAARWTVARSSVAERRALLQRLYSAIKAQRGPLAAALARDLGKSRAEAELSELRPVLDELRHLRHHLAGWMRPQRVATPPILAGSRSEIQSQPQGQVLVMSPWNYPFYLAIMPVVGALAAGNTVMLKPSEKAPHTAQALQRLLEGVVPPTLVSVVQGDAAVAQALLELPFDHFFYTGGARVGRLVMEAAARHHARVTLELGGKSPAVVDATADLPLAARRIAWSKFVNAGQTCVAPDYVLVHESVEEQLLLQLDGEIGRLFGGPAWQRHGPDYARIVDGPAVERLDRLCRESVAQGARVVTGGQFDVAGRFVAPTLLADVRPDMPLMQEEIFGPLLPVLGYRTLDQAVAQVQGQQPLALYVFSRDEGAVQRFEQDTTSGGLVVNGALIHLSNPNLPFGGVGTSGLGGYHGLHSFRTFSHQRAVVREPRVSPVALVYPPYGRLAHRLSAWALRRLGH
ncbi:aldehyde dehydrogenase family protein [Deinococcus sonorensis]|uniref:Aldehyde dehydrogenase n=2 Tax=Deinococcus sonorensis TaxID=309891 RepID=A0AAU7U8H7_9DEIO